MIDQRIYKEQYNTVYFNLPETIIIFLIVYEW